MQDRFTLRFLNGEREGDIVAIGSSRFTLGRRPGNSLQIQDGSVSGNHAEFVVDGDGALVRDLGSTNGTKLAGNKITEARLAHGDEVTFGNIAVIFADGQLLEPSAQVAPVPEASATASAADTGEVVERVSADMIAKSGKRSKVALVGIVALILIGGGVAAFLLTGGGARSGRKLTPVVEVVGNKIGGYSFEGESIPANWSSLESAPADFGQRGEARASGQDGMRAIVAAGQWALLRSESVGVAVGRRLELTARLRARDSAAGRVGVEFLGDEGAGTLASGSNVAWSPWVADVTTHQDLSLEVSVPAGCRSARVVVEARAEGSHGEVTEDDLSGGGYVDVDDIALIDGSGEAAPAARIGEYSLWLHGDPPGVAQLTKVSRSILGNMHGLGALRLRDYPFAVTAGTDGFQLSAKGATSLNLRVEPETVQAGVASIGTGGYTELAGDFDAQDVTVLLLGSGHDLVTLNFDQGSSLRGRLDGEALRISIQLTDAECELQCSFLTERTRAGDLAFAARSAEQSGQLGECLARWNELLETVPYEGKLVAEARSTRARLEQAGLVELAEVSSSFEQARFFRLVDLYRQCRGRAVAVGSKYAGSAVQAQSAELVAQIDESLSGLEADLSRDEVDRLQSILMVLEATESPTLASEVRSYIKEEFGESN